MEAKQNGWLTMLLTSLAVLLSCWKPCLSQPPHPEVHLGPTVITGIHSTTATGKPVHTFLGIPYAEPPTGARRFKPPVPAELPPKLQAQRFGARCPQGSALDPDVMSEDCLFLNVFVPAQDVSEQGLVPVLVWIHGGGFIVGAADVYEGEDLAGEGGVVVVTLNYRLGPLGFLSTGDDASWGNYGLEDQVEALKWVRENILQFGGDKDRVTLAGVSAGAASASLLALSPLSRDLFRHVILLSGSATAPWARVSSAQALQAAEALGQAVGCQVTGQQQNVSTQALVHCLQQQPLNTILAASVVPFPHKVGLSLLDFGWVPVEDGRLVRDVDTVTPFPGPMMAGVVNNEGDTLTSWTVPRISPVIPDAQDLLRKRQFYNQHFLPTLLKQTYPDLVPLPWPTRNDPEKDQAYMNPPYAEALQRLQCAYSLVDDHAEAVGKLREMYGDQGFVLGAVRFLNKFCCSGNHENSSYLYFADYQTKRPGINGFRHLDDLVFLFGFNITLSRRWLGFDGHVTDLDLQLSRDMRQAFVNFIKTGDPNSPERAQGWPFWTPYTTKEENYLHLSPSPAVLSHLRAEQMALWLTDIPQVLSSPDNSTDQWQCQVSSSSGHSMLHALCDSCGSYDGSDGLCLCSLNNCGERCKFSCALCLGYKYWCCIEPS